MKGKTGEKSMEKGEKHDKHLGNQPLDFYSDFVNIQPHPFLKDETFYAVSGLFAFVTSGLT